MGEAVRRGTRARHDALVDLLRAGVESVDTLAGRLGVSASTVRRDLTRLQEEGRIARTYGGALLRDGFHERSFGESAQLHQQEKAAIAEAAEPLVPQEGTVFLDAGTTCLALARRLANRAASAGRAASADRAGRADRTGLTVVTRGLETALLLARSPGIEVVVVGGSVQQLSHGLVGPLASVAFERLAFDAAFLGADAVDPIRGLGEPTVEETYVKEQAAARAAGVVLLADSSKLGPAGVAAWVPLQPSWTLVTDSAVHPATVAAFEAAGLHVLAAG